MRVIIPLIKLDSFFPEDIYLSGEEIFDNQGIEKVLELYKGKVLVTLKDGNKSEIRFNKETIVDIVCSCDIFKIKKMCPHIVAASLEIRKIAEKFAEKKKPLRASRKRDTNDLFNDILNTLEKPELVGFLSAYGNKDKNFRLTFEAFFLNKLKGKELENPYGKLLDEVLPPSSDIEVKFSRQQIALLIDISRDLLNRFKDEVSLKKYTDAFNIIRHLINKLSYASNWNNNEHLTLLMKDAHSSLNLLFEGDIAPELKSRQYDFIFDMLSKSYYNYQAENDIIKLFLSSNPLREDMIRFVEVLGNKLSITKDDDARKYILVFYIVKKKLMDLLEDEWYEYYFNDLSDFMDFALNMINEGFTAELDELLKELYAREKLSKRLFLESQLRISIAIDDCERVGLLTHSIYESTLDFRFIKRTYKCIPGFTEDVINKLNVLVRENAEEDDILNWWTMLKNYPELISFLIERNDISLIQKFETEILDYDEFEIEKLYRNYMFSYLDEHFGTKSTAMVNNLLTHLRKIGARTAASNIYKGILDAYGARKSFLQNLTAIN